MIAIQYERYGGPDVLRVVERDPPAPGRGEILVEVEAASVAPIDWKLRAGLLQNFFQVRFPKQPGRDGAGVVAAVGEGVSRFRVGDRVCVMTGHERDGAYAEFVACPAEMAAAAPHGLPAVEAASLVNAGLSAWIAAVETAEVAPGMKVLVQGGSGAVGGLIVQLARHLGAEVSATCRSANVDYVRALGASRVVPYDREDFVEQVRDQDVVFDLVGGEVHARSYACLRPHGHLVYLVAAPITDRGAEYGVRVTRAMVADRREPLERMFELVESGAIRPQVAGVLPLREAERAHRLVEAGEVTRGRLVLVTG